MKVENKKQSKIFFNEEQRLTDGSEKWIFVVVYVLVIGILGYGIMKQLVLGRPWGSHPMSNSGLLLTFSVVILFLDGIVFLQTRTRLIVYIDNQGIHYRFPVFIRKERLIKKDQIAGYDVIEYHPLKELGRWGLRKSTIYRMADKGITYKIRGNIGLKLLLFDGRRFLLGTQRPEAMKRAMKKLMAENEQIDD